MGHAIPAPFVVRPILWLSTCVDIWGNDATFELHRLDIEGIIIRAGGKPDILHVIFPVRPGAAPLLPLPRNAIPDGEVLKQDAVQGRRRSPVPADIDRPRWLKQSPHLRQPGNEPFFVLIDARFPEGVVVEFLCQIVRRIRDDKVNPPRRQMGQSREQILTDR